MDADIPRIVRHHVKAREGGFLAGLSAFDNLGYLAELIRYAVLSEEVELVSASDHNDLVYKIRIFKCADSVNAYGNVVNEKILLCDLSRGEPLPRSRAQNDRRGKRMLISVPENLLCRR